GSTVEFLRRDFEASKSARWKLLMHHRPMWSASNHGSNLMLQQYWQPIVDEYHVDLVLNGHEHAYEITKPLVGQTVMPSMVDATVYVVAGGAGAELYASGTGFWTQYSESTHNAGLVRVRRDQLTFEAYRPDGTVLPGAFTKTK
ncbi:MAG TPA: metallophosphoesterase, partial [Kofleriaceae bacterium]|nr:metallophosphoesterase [Kofleriaceae bacterium]